jgi:MoaA/NifB/PqqE/SkfB family radical SAM enzyme
MNPFILLKALLTRNVPVYVHYGVTHRCNLRCRMCGLWQTGDEAAELSLSQVEKMAQVLQGLGVQVISLGGGEPLLREDIAGIVRAFAASGISPRLLTNGVIIDRKRLQDVADAGCADFSVSLDSTSPAVVDAILDRLGAFNEIMETISFLSPLIKKKGGLGLINTVVSSKNLDGLPAIVDFAGKAGFQVSFVPVEVQQFSGRPLKCAGEMDEFRLSDGERKKAGAVFRDLAGMKRKGRPIFNSTRFLMAAGRHLSGESPSFPCLAGKLYFSIDPAGNFSMCHRFCGWGDNRRISVLDGDFVKKFHEGSCRQTSKATRGGCRACLRPCWAEVSFLFSDPMSIMEMINNRLQKNK